MASGVVQLRRPDVLDFDQLLPSAAASISGAAYQRRNCDESEDFDPLTNERVRRRKESHQWEQPTGPNQFQQYSRVLDEKTTVAPSVQRTERGHFEYFAASKTDGERTRAVRSEQRVAETRWLQSPADPETRCRGKSSSRSTVRLVTTVESVTTSSSSSSTKAVNDWPNYIALLDSTCNRLDHSVQRSKKNLGKNGSLSQRRRPSRSSINGNMSTIFKSDGLAADNLFNKHLIIKSSALNNHLGFNGRNRPCATIVLPSVNVSTEECYEIQRKVEPPDLIRSVDEAGFHADDRSAENESWLQEAKNKLRRSSSSLHPFEINADASDESSWSNKVRDVQRQVDSASSVSRKSVYSALGLIVMSGGQSTDNRKADNSIDTTNGNEEIRNGCDQDAYNTADAFESLCLQSNNESGSDQSSDGDECHTVIENTQYSSLTAKKEATVKSEVSGSSGTEMGNLLEKNKSKSTSNLDDDETIEAPWFQDAKYRKPKFATREFAKSSLDLQFAERGDQPIGGEQKLMKQLHDRIAVIRNEGASSTVQTDQSLRSAIIHEEEDDEDEQDIVAAKCDNHDITSSEVTVNGENLISSMASQVDTSTLSRSLMRFDSSSGRLQSLPSMCNDNVVIVTSNGQSESITDEWSSSMSSRNTKDAMPAPSRVDAAHRIRLNNAIDISASERSTTTTTTTTAAAAAKSSSWLRDVRLRKIVCSSTELDARSEESMSEDGWEIRRRLSSPQLQCAAMEFNDESDQDDNLRWRPCPPTSVHIKASKLPFGASSVDYRHVESINIEAKDAGSRRRQMTCAAAAGGMSNGIASFMSNAEEVQVVITGNSLDADSWQRIEQEIERNKNRASVEHRQRPDWIREAEDKRRSWTNLSICELPQRCVEGAPKAAWLEEVRLRSTATSPVSKEVDHASNASFPRVHLKHVDMTSTSESQVDDRVESESDRGWSPISSPDDDVALNCSTAWRYVQLKPVVVNNKKKCDEQRRPIDTSTTAIVSFESASDTSEDVGGRDVGGGVSTSSSSIMDADATTQFNVEGYVKRLIDRRRAENRSLQRYSRETEQKKEPDWLQISKRKSQNMVDWNSLDHLNERKSPSSECASWTDVQLRKTPNSLDFAELKKQIEEPSMRSQRTANRISKVQLKSATSDEMDAEKILKRHRPTINANDKVTLSVAGTMPEEQHGSLSRTSKSNRADKSPKKVTFDIPKVHRSSPDLLVRSPDAVAGHPEWVRIAEQKCNRINWDNFEKRETSSRFNSEGRWVTQVQLRHVSKPKCDDDDDNVHVQTPTNQSKSRRPRPTLGLRFSATESDFRRFRHSETDEDDEDDDDETLVSNGTSSSLLWQRDGRQQASSAPFLSLSKWEQVVEKKRMARMKSSRMEDDEMNVRQKASMSNGHGTMDVTLSRPTSLTDVTKVGQVIHASEINKESDSTPSWIQLAKLKRSSSIDWTNIDRDQASSKSAASEEVQWMQEVRLRSTPVSPARSEKEGKIAEGHRLGEDSIIEDVGADEIRWPSTGSKSRGVVDKWQALYQTLFDDLFDQPSAAAGSVPPPVDGSPSPLGITLEPYTRPRKWASPLDGGHHRRLTHRHHRYYSLPEITSCALPRDGREVEIIQLSSAAPVACFDDDFDEDDKLGQKDEVGLRSKQIGFAAAKSEAIKPVVAQEDVEAKPIIFVKLRPTEKKNEDKLNDEEEVAQQPASWLQHVKLRKTKSVTAISAQTIMASKRDEDGDFGHRLNTRSPPRPLSGLRATSLASRTTAAETSSRIRGSPVTMRVSSSSAVTPSAAPRSSLVSSHSVRDAIHRDIRQEVARREKTRSVCFAQDDTPGSSTKVGSPVTPALTAKTESKEKDDGLAFPPKPGWLVELQRKKAEKSKTAPSAIPINVRAPQAPPLPPKSLNVGAVTSPPTFGSVLDQIRSMGKENLFASLRKTRIEIQSRSDSPELSAKTTFTTTSKDGHHTNASELLLITCDDQTVSSASKTSVSPSLSNKTAASAPSSSKPLAVDDYFECQVTSHNNNKNSINNDKRKTTSTRGSRARRSDDGAVSVTPSQVITVTTKWQTTNEGNETFLHEVIVKNNPSEFSKQKLGAGREESGSAKNGAAAASNGEDVFSVNEFLKLRRHNTVDLVPASTSKFKSRRPEVERRHLVAESSDELKSPLLLRTLMSGLTKSKAMYSSDTELNLHSHDRSTTSGLDLGTKLVASKRSMLSLTTLSPPSTTVPYYLMASSPHASTNGDDDNDDDNEADTSGYTSFSSSKSTKELQMSGSDFDVHMTNKYEFNPEASRSDVVSKAKDQTSTEQQRNRRQQNGVASNGQGDATSTSSAIMSGSSDLSVQVSERQEFHVTKRSEQHLILTAD